MDVAQFVGALGGASIVFVLGYLCGRYHDKQENDDG